MPRLIALEAEAVRRENDLAFRFLEVHGEFGHLPESVREVLRDD